MADEHTSRWSILLPRVQLAKNSRYHSGIKMSPFEAMFGRKANQIGYNSRDSEVTDANENGTGL